MCRFWLQLYVYIGLGIGPEIFHAKRFFYHFDPFQDLAEEKRLKDLEEKKR